MIDQLRQQHKIQLKSLESTAEEANTKMGKFDDFLEVHQINLL